MNGAFTVTYTRNGFIHNWYAENLSALSEFIRNCDAYERMLIQVKAV